VTRWRGAFATTALLSAVIGIIGVRPAPLPVEQTRPQPSALSSASPSATGLFYTYHSSTAGFDVRLPLGWTAADKSQLFSRRSVRLLVIGNRRATVPPPPANQQTMPGQVPDWTQLASDQVVLELSESAGPGGPSADASATESSFPLDWSNARPIADGQGNVSTARSLLFQHLLRSFTLVARIGASAPPGDVAEIAGIVTSLTPEPIPTFGEYRGWRVIGPLTSFQIGAVMHFDSSLYRAYGFYFVRGARTVFAFLDSAYLFMGATKPCPIRYEIASRTFVCDATSERWSRVGKQVAGPFSFALAYHTTFVKDGLVLVGGGAGGGGRNTYDEAVEFSDPSVAPVTGASLTRAEILDRYSRLTSTTPVVRAAAKLVPSDHAMINRIISGSFVPTESPTVWVVAFAGDVKLPGSDTSHGRWTVLIADPRTGGVITAACCGDGDWPPGFDQLPDLARN
jgi:hypothetical protein